MNNGTHIIITNCNSHSQYFELINKNNITFTLDCNNEMTDIYRILGYIGSAGIVFTYLPQVIKVYKTKSTNDLSIKYIVIGLIATLFMLCYGVLIYELPLIIANPLIGAELILMLLAKLIFEKKCQCIKNNNSHNNSDLDQKHIELAPNLTSYSDIETNQDNNNCDNNHSNKLTDNEIGN